MTSTEVWPWGQPSVTLEARYKSEKPLMCCFWLRTAGLCPGWGCPRSCDAPAHVRAAAPATCTASLNHLKVNARINKFGASETKTVRKTYDHAFKYAIKLKNIFNPSSSDMIRVIYIVQAWSPLLDCSRHTDCAKDQIIHFSLNTDFYRIFSDFNLTVPD